MLRYFQNQDGKGWEQGAESAERSLNLVVHLFSARHGAKRAHSELQDDHWRSIKLATYTRGSDMCNGFLWMSRIC